MISIVLLLLFVTIVVVAIVVAVLICLSSKRVKRKNDMHISGGVNIETGQFYTDNNFFKGITGEIEDTMVIGDNYQSEIPFSFNVKITNMNTGDTRNCRVSESLVIGRAKCYNCDAFLKDASISNEHCMLYIANNCLYISDMKSFNHTYLNGNIVIEPCVCQSGSTIKIGNTKLLLTIE